MLLVNETGVPVQYWISAAGMGDCGSIAVNGLVDLPGYDNQTNVTVEFLPSTGTPALRGDHPAIANRQSGRDGLVAPER